MSVFSLFLVLMTLTLHCQCQNFTIVDPESEVSVKHVLDPHLDLTCTGSEPWAYCRWSFYQRVCSRTLDLNSPYCTIDERGRITWQGVPAIDQKCTIRVKDPDLMDSGSWTCQLIQDDNEVATKSFKVNVFTQAEVRFASRYKYICIK